MTVVVAEKAEDHQYECSFHVRAAEAFSCAENHTGVSAACLEKCSIP